MSIRPHEIHPALVHLPLAFLPLAIGTDMLGCATGDRDLLKAGRRAITLAAIGGALSILSGLVAQEEVNVEGESMDMLITHRNINLAAGVAVASMAAWRSGRERPGPAYLGVGLVGIAALVYTAYLGGKLVYERGVGVEPAHGQYREHPPVLRRGQVRAFSKALTTDLVHGVSHLAQELRKGKIAPSLGIGRRPPGLVRSRFLRPQLPNLDSEMRAVEARP